MNGCRGSAVRAALLVGAIGLGATLRSGSQEADTPRDGPPKPAKPSREELEKEFAKTLSGATLAGKWRLVKDGEIGEERDEKYTLGEVRKLGEDRWLIEARIQYADKDVRLPVPVKVLWAGDTPVISVTDWGFPGLGTYTARVMVYNGLYTGTWFGKGYGGLMSGRILPAGDSEAGAGEE